MFEELIAQGNDMIRRQEKQVGLSYTGLKAIPEHELVSGIEYMAWRKTIEERINSSFGADALARYQIIWEIHKHDVEKQTGDESSRYVNAWRRIVAYLVELQGRIDTKGKAEDGTLKSPSGL
jgi:hypothetical protein